MDKQRLLITGGTGFVGTHLAQRLQQYYDVVRGHSPDEEPLDDNTISFDLANADEVEQKIQQIKPTIIIHAGAISSLVEAEEHPFRAIDGNINGTKNIASSALKHHVAFVLGISSNKAALPSSLYSHTKAILERTFARLNNSTTAFATVRFGNLLWAPGSFLIKWREMTEQDGIVRSTGVNHKRFLQTIEHGGQLVQALLQNQAKITGSVITPALKAASIKDVLDLWVKKKNCSLEEQESRSIDVPKDVLIGEAEFSDTISTTIDNMPCFKTNFGQKPEQHVGGQIHSENAALYTQEELEHLIEL